MFFLHTLAFVDVTSIIIGVVELIFSGETFEGAVCENARLIFPLSL